MTAADVIVIGGGPAGVAAAITCVQGGLGVMLLTDQPEIDLADAETQPPEPLQSLHPGVQTLLQQLQIEGVTAYASKGIYTGIKTGAHVSPLSTVEEETWTGHHIAPRLFSAYTLLKVKEMGVDVRFVSRANEIICSDEAVTGVVLADGTTLGCKYLIDASGRGRFAGRYLKFDEELLSRPLLSWTGISMDEQGEAPDRELALFEPNPYGWTWTAYSSNGYHTQTKLADKSNSYAFAKELSASPQAAKIKAANMQWRVFKPLACPGLLLTGDAAGILDPAAGQGILSGLMSGIMAGETVLSCLANAQLSNWYLSRYDNWFMEQFNHKKDTLTKRYREMGIDVSL
ncbi:FAD-dependent oxidoreductase [Mucilaginibacter sp. ZT4R22]|uniref:FAD-dependent oxidoreductase n=1 Tax=Mucilaginibacter pankratovii TaxID=2772110 RepID=A0ABR7WJT0_9SPHI|nr:FAD-dependent oxidoreductase [Mucilaginibacter pankratovii]MBD1362343.1 FAD-dependent oxidoreductase [Mucilaginibacter pankratovii]